MERRDAWIKSTTRKAAAVAPVKAPTVDETRTEQNAARKIVAASPSTGTVKTPTKPGITGEIAPLKPQSVLANAGKVMAAPASSAPSTKPTYKTIQVENPEYTAWRSAQAKANSALVGIHDREEDRIAALNAPKVAPNVPPAPARFIEKRVLVAPQPMSRPVATDTSGLYRIRSGDTLGAISKRSGVSVAELARINGIADPNKIVAGQSIRLRANGAAVPLSAAPKASTGSTAARSAAAKSTTSAPTVVKGSSTGRDYVVGRVYVNGQGVKKKLMPDGKFVTVH